MEERPILGFKVKSQLSAWTTSAAECADGFCKKVKSQLSAWTNFATECAEDLRRKVLQLSVQLWVFEKICS